MTTKKRTYKKSSQLLEESKQLIPGGCSTEGKISEKLFVGGMVPAFFKRARGVKITDVDGNQFIDFAMALGPCILGYNHPAIVESIDQELKRGFISTLPSVIEPQLAELIVDIFPSIEMVRFLKTGAEACSAAIRLARAFTNRNHILSSGYFGWHDWSQKGSGIPAAVQDLHSDFVFNDPMDFLNKLERLSEVPAAVVMEPVVQEQPEIEFLSVIRESCDKFNIVLIWDEVKTGARMAPGGAQQYYSFKPDLTILGKGIANGMPLAAVGGKKEIMEAWDKTWISSTFAGESLSLAAAITTLNFIRHNPVCTHLEKMGKRLLNGFEKIAAAFPDLCAFSGIPQMSTIGLREDLHDLQNLEREFFHSLLGSGFIIKRRGYNFVSFIHTSKHIDDCLRAIRKAFSHIKRKRQAAGFNSQ